MSPIFIKALPLICFCAVMPASAEIECQSLISVIRASTNGGARAIRITNLPPVTDLALPKSFIERFRQSYLYKKLEPLRQSGRKISLKTYDGIDELLGLDTTNGFGETIQGIFLKKMVTVLTHSSVVSHDAPLEVRIDLFDSFEGDDSTHWGGFITGRASDIERHDFEMSEIKAVNPSFGTGKRSLLRATLGIPAQSRVVSLYTNEFFEDFTDISHEFRSPPDIVFVSAHGYVGSLESTKANVKRYLSNYHFVKLSEVTPLTFRKVAKMIIYNDLSGYVPYLHAVSDLAYVTGPINFFESISVGTPTVWRNTCEIRPKSATYSGLMSAT